MPDPRVLALAAVGGPVVLTAGVLAAIERQRRRHRPLVERVPPDLRQPRLDLPFSVRTRWHGRLLRRLLAAPSARHPDVTVTEHRISPDHALPVLVHRPERPAEDAGGPAGGLLWIHGGGLVAGSPQSCQDVCGWLAAELGVVVVAVGYRLAPEHPFPAALDDCHAALRWMHEDAAALGLDRGRIAVAGASAGGGLAATLVQRVHDEGVLPVCFQALLYPMLDDRTVLRPVSRRPWLVWTPASNRYGWTAYLGHRPREHESRPYVAAARRSDLRGLPPAWIGVGDLDLFHEEDLDYARRLRAAGVACALHEAPGMYHGADAAHADSTETTRTLRADLLAALRPHLQGARPAI